MNKRDELGDKIKQWECQYDVKLDPSLPLVARLDGCSFHTYTKGFKKPHDELISKPMIETTKDLVKKFKASLGYTQSDEITLVFTPASKDKNGQYQCIYSYRLEKLCSILASYASVRFNYYSNKYSYEKIAEDAPPNIIEKMRQGIAFFDARVFSVPDIKGAVDSIYWRHNYDCRRNAIAGLGHAHFSQKQLHGKNTSGILEMLKEKNIMFNDTPSWYQFGTFCKRIAVLYKDNNNQYIRTDIHSWSKQWSESDQDKIELITNKYYNQDQYNEWNQNNP